ncbi:hypothetical protein HRI_004394300 [Hibiscus trionum]|uniref:Stress induced protein n=1 Tax=Hibiscus trionum TaxID=183268 RepID=A0A9W7J2E2_HIBTR|nr:hypothetical protein HRI_004394300 [Hibiscus trionum]
MANSQEKSIFMQAELDVDQVEYEDEVRGNGCSCFNLFCFKWRRFNDIHESDTLLHRRGEEHTETWWKSKLNKLKQVSEKIAGPKWKNFVRKMSGYCHKRKCQKNRFQYDPCSYALNFDNGADKGDDLLRNFSSRFAASFEDDRQQARPGM